MGEKHPKSYFQILKWYFQIDKAGGPGYNELYCAIGEKMGLYEQK